MYEVKIIDLDHQGRGIGRINNKVIFIENTLIDEIVKIKIIKETTKYLEGEVIEYIKKSNERIEKICKYNCGGCNLLHMSYDKQLDYKQTKIENIINKFTNINTKINKIIPSPNIYNYRNKVIFHIDKKIGLYKSKSNEIIEIDKCLLVDEKINELYKEISKLPFNSKNEVMIRSTTNETMIMVDNYIEGIEEVDATTIICNNKILKGKGYIYEYLDNYKFKISSNSFFQVNTKQTINLYNKVVEYASLTGKENVLDLYCGTGTIGIYLSKYANKVLGIEFNKDAVENANDNKIINNIKNIEFICKDAKEFIKNNKFKTDILVIDPPRSGLYKGMIDDIRKINPKKIICISCNPITLARDLNELNTTYEVIEIQPVDMFPNTHHCEALAVLERK